MKHLLPGRAGHGVQAQEASVRAWSISGAYTHNTEGETIPTPTLLWYIPLVCPMALCQILDCYQHKREVVLHKL